jgi:hypothetical protein
MERALEPQKIPPSFRLFPGKGRGLGKNPWPGCVKPQEELMWLEKQDGTQDNLQRKGRLRPSIQEASGRS